MLYNTIPVKQTHMLNNHLQLKIEEIFFILNYNKFNETKQKKCSI